MSVWISESRFFIVNPKSYIFGDDVLKLAKLADELAQKYDIDCIFTGQLIDLPNDKKKQLRI